MTIRHINTIGESQENKSRQNRRRIRKRCPQRRPARMLLSHNRPFSSCHIRIPGFTSLPSAMSFCIAPANPTRITNTPSASLYYRSQYATRQSCRDTIYTRPIFPCRCQVRRSALYYRHRCKRISRLKLPIANARGFLSTIAFLALERCKC